MHRHNSRTTGVASRGQAALALSALIATAAATVLAVGGGSTSARQNALDGRMTPTARALADLTNETLGLVTSDIVTLDGIDPTPGQTQEITITIAGQDLDLLVSPHSVRSELYQVFRAGADGVLIPVEPQPVRTVRGVVDGMEGTLVAGSITPEGGLAAVVVLPDGSSHFVEPLAPHLPEQGLAAETHVVYDIANVIPGAGTCGWTEDMIDGWEVDPAPGGGGIAGAGLFDCTELGIDADFEFYQDFGSSVANVENQINNVINTMNNQWETQVDVTFIISTIIVRDNAADPYTQFDAVALLNQFANVWNTAPESSIPRDVAQLFTGRNLNGSTIGIAVTPSTCNVSNAYSVVENISPMSCATDLSSHELGHTFNALHCNCPSNTMNSGLTCANNFTQASINAITGYANAVGCLDDCPGAGIFTTIPFFDNFPSSTFDDTKWFSAFGDALINGSGTNEPSTPWSVNLDGSSTGGNELRTNLIDASVFCELTLSYFWQRTGGGNSPESGEDLVVEFLDASSSWIEINRHLGNGPDMTTYDFASIDLPAEAYHGNMRVRFRVLSSDAGADDWFIDDVSIDGDPQPNNSLCSSATLVSAGSHAFTTVGACTDGFDDSGACGGFSAERDVWFRTFAGCEGDLELSLSGVPGTASLVAYQSFVCPSGDDQATDCVTGTSTLTLSVTPGTGVRIRIGSTDGSTFSGTLNVACNPIDTCVEDCDGSGDGGVDVTDLLALLGQWGGPGGCDNDGSGTIDVVDLLALLAAWGPTCP